MPIRNPQKAVRRSKTGQAAAGATSGRLNQISKSTAQIVKDAAALLDEEVAAGIVAAKQMQRRFQKERRIDPTDFKGALEKFQGDAHEVINLLNDRLADMRLQENFELIKRFVEKTHDVVDLAAEFVNSSAEIVNQLTKSSLSKRTAGSRESRNR